jgi:hypothetical protein
MRTIFVTFALALLAAGCGGREPAATNAAADNAIEDAQNRLAALPEGQRNGVFIRAIRDAGQACQHVDSSERVGEYRGNPVWRAHCDEGGSSWTIVVTADGTAQIINDAEARLAGLNMVEPAENEAAAAGQNRQ